MKKGYMHATSGSCQLISLLYQLTLYIISLSKIHFYGSAAAQSSPTITIKKLKTQFTRIKKVIDTFQKK